MWKMLLCISSIQILSTCPLAADLAKSFAAPLAHLLKCSAFHLRNPWRTIKISSMICPYLQRVEAWPFIAWITIWESSSKMISCIPKSLQNSAAIKAPMASATIGSRHAFAVRLSAALTIPSESRIMTQNPQRLCSVFKAISQFALKDPLGGLRHCTRSSTVWFHHWSFCMQSP